MGLLLNNKKFILSILRPYEIYKFFIINNLSICLYISTII